ncbi:hypothetical protein WJX82_008830 [Trebouxia sp. C0006]
MQAASAGVRLRSRLLNSFELAERTDMQSRCNVSRLPQQCNVAVVHAHETSHFDFQHNRTIPSHNNLAMVNELLETASRTDGGASTSQDQRKTIRDLAEQLRDAGGVQNPVYSDLAWGEYEASKTSAVLSICSLPDNHSSSDSLVNSVSFKALGIFPGNAIQDAVIETLSGTKYKLILQPAKIFGIQLGPSKSIERVFDVLYLDEKVRVVEFLPDQSPNSNSSEPVLFVLRRLSNVQHPQSSTQKQASNQLQNAWEALQQTMKMGDLSSKQNGAGLATQAERKFKRENR